VVSKEKSRKQTLTALVSITLQIVVPIYKGFVNLITNSFKTQVAILDNECGCLLVTIPRKQRYSEDWKLIFLNSSILVLNPLAPNTITSSKSYTLCRRLLIVEVALSNQWQFSHLFPGVYYIVRSAYILKILDELTTVKDVLL
jgi:hypothetical protein